jgi:Flp pilus assembly protein TadG
MRHWPVFSSRKQRGIAALEFTILALFVMVPVFLGVFVFWEVLQTQQVITRATGDGARQVSRMLNTARAKKPDGSYPSSTEARNTAAALARASISAALRSHLGSDVDSRLTVDLQPSGADQLALNVTYARPALLGAAGGLNFIEPQSLQARSLINGH